MNTGPEEKRQALVELLNTTPLFFSNFTNVITGLEIARIEVCKNSPRLNARSSISSGRHSRTYSLPLKNRKRPACSYRLTV